jgi:hypothetical protein
MPELSVVPVTSRSQQRQFLELPWRLYRGDPNWIPPLRDNQRRLVGYGKHPFYEQAEAQTFLAMRGGEAIGRIAAILNRAHNARHKENRGFFGFFECVDDKQAAGLLFDAVREWFATRGVTAIRGPMNPSMNYECGLLIDGFQQAPTFMMTYNPPYYAKFVESAGYRKCQDLYTYIGELQRIWTLDSKLVKATLNSRERFSIETRPLKRSRFMRDVRLFLEIYNASLPETWGFVPLSEAEIRLLARDLRFLIVPELTSLAETGGEPIGAVFGIPDYNPRIRAIDGRLFPLGFLRLLWRRRRIDKVRLVSTNVMPAYQMWGVGLVLVHSLVRAALDRKIKVFEFSWVLESNHLSKSTLERGGAVLEKTHRIYDLS